jgi:hypothetical protein
MGQAACRLDEARRGVLLGSVRERDLGSGNRRHAETGKHAKAKRHALARGALFLLVMHLIASRRGVVRICHGRRMRRGHGHGARLRGNGEGRRDKRADQIPQETRIPPHLGKLDFSNASFNAHSAAGGGGRPTRANPGRGLALLRDAHDLSRI